MSLCSIKKERKLSLIIEENRSQMLKSKFNTWERGNKNESKKHFSAMSNIYKKCRFHSVSIVFAVNDYWNDGVTISTLSLYLHLTIGVMLNMFPYHFCLVLSFDTWFKSILSRRFQSLTLLFNVSIIIQWRLNADGHQVWEGKNDGVSKEKRGVWTGR